ncbi:L-aspartate oxidase [Anoxybacillus flavithermus]|uniref:L-aspartate oxidase n=1 Tax=Anoxybacillus flavithermus TaxID=33934 RepID=A0A2G5RPT7_9BACL|nr:MULTISPECIES: L-aspartate oxidase [Anoxybacillus]KFZ43902.1 L-aspartate oxidase [Anoxybacillus sp. KU2-6(11)]PIC04702.1 L-aspartate oxidase [Anoxybacillus flavithermus]
MREADVIIVGSGLAGLMVAYHLCQHKNVIVFTKSNKETSNSWLAQGGVAAAIHPDDHWLSHYTDTMIAGCEHNDDEAVRILVQEGREAIQHFMNIGFLFDVGERGQLLFGQEGAHRMRRILHAGGDATGKNMVSFLFEKLSNRVTFIENDPVIDLLVSDGHCVGVQTKNGTYTASAIVIATGGIGQLYAFTSNTETATGDGIAMAYRAGAAVADMEFVQFHPTMLYVDGKAVGLISEAVRGEGAMLVTDDGRRVMDGVHPQKDLAPRDVVSRAIEREMKNGHFVFLDVSMIPHFSSRFPTITSLCERYQIDWRNGLLPVVPGAHFLMGGIVVNVDGETTLPGLYAVGEAACTGVHGANRLASNSLLEALVFSRRVAFQLLNKTEQRLTLKKSERKENNVRVALPTKEDIQRMMTQYVGIVREYDQLFYAKQWFEQYSIDELVNMAPEHDDEKRTIIYMLIVGWLITTSALQRKESRGAHYRSDEPFEKMYWEKRRIIRTKAEHLIKEGFC